MKVNKPKRSDLMFQLGDIIETSHNDFYLVFKEGDDRYCLVGLEGKCRANGHYSSLEGLTREATRAPWFSRHYPKSKYEIDLREVLR